MPVTIRNAPGGPLIRSRVRPMNWRPQNCFRVLVRWNHGPTAGKWDVLSTSGFTVVCVSNMQAEELVLLVGGKHFPRPPHLCVIDADDERRYTRWLLRHYFRIDSLTGETVGPFNEEGVCRRPPQVLFSSFLRGWYPAAEDVLEMSSFAAGLVEPALRRSWEGL